MKRTAACACALLLAACASLTPQAPPPARQFLDYLAALRTLDEAGVAAEARRSREQARREPSDLATLQAALVLSVSPNADDAEVMAMVEPLRGARDADVRAMASFLHAISSERLRLRDTAAAAANRAREDRRALDAQRLRAEALQERAAQLQQKLDALTTLEKSIAERERQGK